jgi:hypothetical protein
MARDALNLMLNEATYQATLADPLNAIRAVARGLSHQSTGAQQSVLRVLVTELVAGAPAILPGIVADVLHLQSKG